MKDLAHHRNHLVKKVIQGIRRMGVLVEEQGLINGHRSHMLSAPAVKLTNSPKRINKQASKSRKRRLGRMR